jgi:Uma2 family endonuclease
MQIVRRKFTVTDYHRMVDAGILHPKDRVELINGEIIEMAPIDSVHVANVHRINQLFVERAAGKLIVSVQSPVHLGEHSEPEPDIALLRYRDDFYRDELPTAEDVRLVIEVAKSSLAFDRSTKCTLYARHGIPVYWLVDPEAKTITKFSAPAESGYRESEVFSTQDTIDSPLGSMPVGELIV